MHMMEQRYVSVLLEDWDNEEELYRRIVKLSATLSQNRPTNWQNNCNIS